MADFFQEGPVLSNQYKSDQLLQSYLQRVLPKETFEQIEGDLINLGERVVSDIYTLAKEAQEQEPKLISHDPWGRRIDEIKTSAAWKELDRISATEGMVAIGYERNFAEFSRIYQFAKLYLFNPSSAIYTCPLAMSDGAARLIELSGDKNLKERAFRNLTSRNPDNFWTSGQWMTEKTGGSDVGKTQTLAKFENGEYHLSGTKWFTSATTSQMAMTLARIVDSDEKLVEGSRGLSLFYLELRDDSGKLNNIFINRLKNKLGTKALPTAEIELRGTKAQLIGEPGQGVKNISTLFNITRIYNANSSIALMRRALVLLRDYSFKREAFGKKLADLPLHYETVSRLEILFQASFILSFYTVELLGKEENGKINKEEQKILRLLTPLVKLYTAKQAVKVIGEVIELFGGAGYVEDTGIPVLLRDATVLSIWEGTTNVLCLDVLRAINKEEAFLPMLENIRIRMEKIKSVQLQKQKEKILDYLPQINNLGKKTSEVYLGEAGSREFCFALAEVFAGSLLLEQAEWEINSDNKTKTVIIAKRWCERELIAKTFLEEEYLQESKLIAFGSLNKFNC